MKTTYIILGLVIFLAAYLLAVHNLKARKHHATPDSYQLSEREAKR